MQIVLTNKKPHSLISIIDRKSCRTIDLKHGESVTLFVNSDDEVREYRDSYEVFGVDISIKEPTEVFVNEPVELKAEEPAKPRRSRRKSSVETVSVEDLGVKEAEVKEELKAEEPKVEEVPATEEPKEEVSE